MRHDGREGRRRPRSAGAAWGHGAAGEGLGQELLRRAFPELRHRGDGEDDGVLQLALAVALHPADVDVLDGVAVGVELHRSARRVGDLDLPEGREELLAVLHVAAQRADVLVDPAPTRVVRLREVRRDLAEARAVLPGEATAGPGTAGPASPHPAARVPPPLARTGEPRR